MELLVVRHAIAEEREEFAQTGKIDDLRPLTKKGSIRMEAGARGLALLVEKPDAIMTSPLTRAAETAALLAAAFEGPEPQALDALKPGADYESLASWLRARGDQDGRVALVGHEPHLSGLICLLLSGGPGSFLELKKGGACLLTVPPSVAPGSAVLHWAATPGQLRKIGGD
jgi:phosphohistidine phosphatase